MRTNAPSTFGIVLRRFRQAAGLTQEALGERAGLSARGISDLERGISRVPQRETAARLADGLALPPSGRERLLAAARSGAPWPDAVPSPTPGRPRRSDHLLAPENAAGLLVGRADELALLEAHLAGKGPVLLLLAGIPGIGKSRLLREAATRAARMEWEVVAGGCTRGGGQEPLAPLPQALQGRLAVLAPDQLRSMLVGCAWLVRMLPELGDGPIEPLPSWTPAPAQERRLMFEAVGRCLANMAGSHGTLLLLDDLQWAGADALDLLAALVRTAGHRLRIVGAYREGAVGKGHPLEALLTDLASGGLVQRWLVEPLEPTDAERLLGAVASGVLAPAWRASVLTRAGGVPFYLRSFALRAANTLTETEAVPWDVAQSIRGRVAALSPSARELLGLAAVVGRAIQPLLLKAIAARGEDVVLEALEEAYQARLLDEADGGNYTFAHDLIREVVEADLGAARRQALHRRVARALAHRAAESPLELVAYHYTRGGDPDQAVPYWEQAGDRARAQYAYSAAETYYREALGPLDHRQQRESAAAVREKLGSMLRTAGHYDAALAELEQAAVDYRTTGELNRLGWVMGQIGLVHFDRGTAMEPLVRLQHLLTELEEHQAWAGVAEVCLALSDLHLWLGSPQDQLAMAERAIRLVRGLDNGRVPAAAQLCFGTALFFAGRRDEALPILEEAIRLAEATGDLTSLGYALQSASGIYADRGAWEQHRRYSNRAVACAEQLGNPAAVVVMRAIRGLYTYFYGDWEQARADFEQALMVGRAHGITQATLPLTYLGQLCLSTGDWQGATYHLDEAMRLPGARGANQHGPVQLLLARRDIMTGRLAEARIRIADCERWPNLWDEHEWAQLPVRVLSAWLYLEQDDVTRAAALASEAVAVTRAAHLQRGLMEALWIQARTACKQHCWAEACQALEEGLSLAHRLHCPYAEARLLHVYGRLHGTQTKAKQAEERLTVALAIFRQLGAQHDAAQVELDLANLRR